MIDFVGQYHPVFFLIIFFYHMVWGGAGVQETTGYFVSRKGDTTLIILYSAQEAATKKYGIKVAHMAIIKIEDWVYLAIF